MIPVNKLNTPVGPMKVTQTDKNLEYAGGAVHGLCLIGTDFDIKLRKGLNEFLEKQTFMHEMLHTIEIMNGLEFEEYEIDTLATGLIFLMRNNPKVVEWIQK